MEYKLKKKKEERVDKNGQWCPAEPETRQKTFCFYDGGTEVRGKLSNKPR